MGIVVVVIVSVLLIGAGVGACIFISKQAGASAGADLGPLSNELSRREALLAKLQDLYNKVVPIPALRVKAKELQGAEESLKAERGRITITQAELETIETRLRELEEIQRELEASGVETQEELKILQRKQGELQQKNSELKEQIAESNKQLESLLGEVELGAQAQEQIQGMKGQLLETEQKIEVMLREIERSNEEYFVLKRRYDALDIEYAQLYEKFTEAEALLANSKEGQ